MLYQSEPHRVFVYLRTIAALAEGVTLHFSVAYFAVIPFIIISSKHGKLCFIISQERHVCNYTSTKTGDQHLKNDNNSKIWNYTASPASAGAYTGALRVT